MLRHAPKLECSEDVLNQLVVLSKSRTEEVRKVERARIILACLQGKENQQVAREVGAAIPTVSKWRRRFAERGWEGLRDGPRSGKPPTYGPALRDARMALQMSQYYEEARELARLITEWSLGLKNGSHFLVVCSGGGPGIMEAANRGASEAGGVTIGFNIKLPMEQSPNPYITPELNFMFRYFFMRKLWFAQPSRAVIVFPGGFGTMDEMWEFLTLIQTHKMGHRCTLLLYGSKYWKKVLNFDWLAEAGTVSREEMKLIRFVNTPQEAFGVVKEKLTRLLHLPGSPRYPFI